VFDPERADSSGLVAIGGKLEPELLLTAFREGVFPWSSKPSVRWYSPDPRAIFDLQTWRAHRSTLKSARRGGWRFTVDACFVEVMRACADRLSTWITTDFIRAYTTLHERGHAHSVEVWEGEDLVGGLYGATVGGWFGGESMFHRTTDASKAAVGHLIERLRACGFALCDAQVPTDHLTSIGATTIPRREYLERLARAIHLTAQLR
jgi:leucyl/phenylalanyl-tRNA--protein transferase